MISYHLYWNNGSGPIDYTIPIATVTGTSWTSGVLSAPGDFQFGVRAFDPSTGLEELNLDAAVEIVIDATGKDITNVPAAVTAIRAIPLANGAIRAEWWYPLTFGPKTPIGFHVYLGIVFPAPESLLLESGDTLLLESGDALLLEGSVSTGSPGYSAPVATVLYSSGFMNTFRADIPGLTDGYTYVVGVRAYNAVGEESNTLTATVTADATGPSPVDSLTATAIV